MCDKKKYFTVYEITNKINGKIYIGVHGTNNLNDKYMGSGILIKKAILKYGIENFERKYLFIFENRKEMFEKEKELVNENFINDSNTYNISIGGESAFGNDMIIVKNLLTDKNVLIHKNVFLSNKDKFKGRNYQQILCLDIEQNTYKMVSKNDKEYLKKYFPHFKGKKHSKETKKVIGNKSKVHQKGKGNSQFNTCWIYNLDLKESKKIKKEELENYLSLGWLKGRKLKF